MNLSWAISIFFFVCIMALVLKVTTIQDKIDRHEKVLFSCINEKPFIFKADKEEDNVVIICKRF